MADPDHATSTVSDFVYLPPATCSECGVRSVFAEITPYEAPVLLCIDCRLLGRLMDHELEGG